MWYFVLSAILFGVSMGVLGHWFEDRQERRAERRRKFVFYIDGVEFWGNRSGSRRSNRTRTTS
jgi:hypothetical protein